MSGDQSRMGAWLSRKLAYLAGSEPVALGVRLSPPAPDEALVTSELSGVF